MQIQSKYTFKNYLRSDRKGQLNIIHKTEYKNKQKMRDKRDLMLY